MLSIQEVKTEGVVDSLNHPLAIYLRRFLTRETRVDMQEIIVDDIENIEEALKAGIVFKKWFISGLNLHIPQTFYEKLSSVPLYEIAPRTCKKIFEHEKMSRIFAIADLPDTSVLAKQFSTTQRDIAVLDGVSITGNIGAMIRTATAFDLGGIVILNTHPTDIYDRRIIRASRGHIFKLPMASASLEEFLVFCKKYHFKTLAATPQAKQTVDQIASVSDKLAIILGSEKQGCSDELKQSADVSITIPMNSQVESLNVSVAAGIIFYLRRSKHLNS